jgi:hypothetical protein
MGFIFDIIVGFFGDILAMNGVIGGDVRANSPAR